MKSFHKECLICKSNKIKNMRGYEQSYLVKCEECSFVFSGLIPTYDELAEHYEKYNRENIQLSPITIKRYHELLDKFEPFRKNNTILDIGCGVGSFLEIAKKRGWNVYGTEISEKAIRVCENKGIAVKKGVLNPDDFGREFFDVITSFEVIEHINNPLDEVRNIREIVRTNGLVYVTTPNFNALERLLLRDNYNVIEYPEHLSYYTKKTLIRLFSDNGFKNIKISATGISLNRILRSFERTKRIKQNDKKYANHDDTIRELTEKSIVGGLFKNFANHLLDFLSLGNSLKGYFIKI